MSKEQKARDLSFVFPMSNIRRGGEALPVGRLAFKAREGRQTALSGFDSHSLPPIRGYLGQYRDRLGVLLTDVLIRKAKRLPSRPNCADPLSPLLSPPCPFYSAGAPLHLTFIWIK